MNILFKKIIITVINILIIIFTLQENHEIETNF